MQPSHGMVIRTMSVGTHFWRVFISASAFGYYLSVWEIYCSLAHGKDVFFSGSLIERRFPEIELVLAGLS
jgi:hypothetical protein